MLATSYPVATEDPTVILADLDPDPAIAIDPDKFELGFQHGRRAMMRGSFCQDESYLLGFRSGLKFYRCALPDTTEGALEVGWGDERLNAI